MDKIDSFAREQKVVNGKVYSAGDVYAMKPFGAFSDLVILGFNDFDQVKVSRPYLYASGVGTTGPTPLLGCETFVLPIAHLEHFEKKDEGRTV